MITDKIRKDLTQAMKSKQDLRVSTLRMMLSGIVNKEKEKGEAVSEEAAVKVFFSTTSSGRMQHNSSATQEGPMQPGKRRKK